MKTKLGLTLALCTATILLLAGKANSQAQELKRIPPSKTNLPPINKPSIVRFSTTAAPCRIFREGFLSFQVSGKVQKVEISAVYADGRRRPCYSREYNPPANGQSASQIADPAMDGGILSYELKATGPNGLFATRSLSFRTPKTVAFVLYSPAVRRNIESVQGNFTRIRWVADANLTNISRIVFRGRMDDGYITQGSGHSDRSRIWLDVTYDTRAINVRQGVAWEIHAWGNDGCRAEDWEIVRNGASAPSR